MGSKKKVDDRFKDFGTVSFTAISRVNDFVDYLKDGRVMGTRCDGCDRHFFPPRADCSQCLDNQMEWFEVTGTGRLISFSRLQFAPVGFENDVPYCIAVVDFGSFKVFGRIAGDIAFEDLSAGMEMGVAANPLEGGRYNFVFTKA